MSINASITSFFFFLVLASSFGIFRLSTLQLPFTAIQNQFVTFSLPLSSMLTWLMENHLRENSVNNHQAIFGFSNLYFLSFSIFPNITKVEPLKLIFLTKQQSDDREIYTRIFGRWDLPTKHTNAILIGTILYCRNNTNFWNFVSLDLSVILHICSPKSFKPPPSN